MFNQIVPEEYKPEKLIIFSKDELKQLEMFQKWNMNKYPRTRQFFCDVRDKDRLLRAFHAVDYVIHAVAPKQVPAVEYYSAESIKKNIIGAMNAIDAVLH